MLTTAIVTQFVTIYGREYVLDTLFLSIIGKNRKERFKVIEISKELVK
jgi:hypothetical protein